MFFVHIYFLLKEHFAHPSEIEAGMMIVDEKINLVIESVKHSLTYKENIYAYGPKGERLIR